MTNTDYTRFFQFTPAPEQHRAVELAAANPVVIVTGGPGVGKTATTNAIIGMFEEEDLHVVCCAPTGKAAQRMAEQTGHAACTIHRLLAYNPDGSFARDAEDPIVADVVILDEASMVDSVLFAALLDAIPRQARSIVIVGDVDQLPSIGAGRVLYDLIESGTVPTIRLTKIFRQASESRIPYVARDINTGAAPDVAALDKSGDVVFAPVESPEDIAQAVISAFRTHIPNRGFRQEDIQVLCPQRSGPCGVESLNVVLQRELNPSAYPDAVHVAIGNHYQAYMGDRVIHTKNNYKLNVFNGEIGHVTRCNWRGLGDVGKAETGESKGPFVLTVAFDGREVAYTKTAAYDLQLAYAITIHKAQGSQFKAVVLPVSSSHTFMLTRPLVYTGITRASDLLLMVGEESALAGAAVNTRGVQRRTTLRAALR